MRRTPRFAVLLVALLAGLSTLAGTASARTPFVKPFMGWSSWSLESSTRTGYGTSWLTESHVRDASDALATKLKSAGYTYINIDAGWNANLSWVFHTDVNGIPDPDPARFPSGIGALASYVHAKGQKLGLYVVTGLEKEVYNKNAPIQGTSCRAQDLAYQPLTPSNGWGGNWKIDFTNPCTQKYFDSIVKRFASWGVDFIKVDGTTADNVGDIAVWSAAIDHSRRPMWLTASAWPVPRSIGPALSSLSNGVRVDTDVECYCETVSTWDSSVKARWSDLPSWQGVFGRDYRPDLDAMPINNNVGNGIQDGINDVERQSVMTFWSMASSPLYVGSDIYFMDSKAVSILTNPEVIKVDQSGTYATQVTGGTLPVWKKKAPDGRWYVAVYNLGAAAADVKVDLGSLGFYGPRRVRDLVSRTDLGSFAGSWTATAVPAHGSRLIRVG